MIELPLAARYSEFPRRPAAAWLIPGAGPQEWLCELDASDGTEGWRFYAVPRSSGDPRPLGLLAVAGVSRTSDQDSGRHAGRCQGYACLAKQLYVPVEAEFDPPLSESDIAALLRGDEKVYVFHPAAGWSAFAPQESLDLCGLLTPPSEQSADWGRAHPGVAAAPRLTAIEPEESIAVESFFEGVREELGDERADLDDLPPSPEEPAGGFLSGVGRAVQKMLAKAIQKLAGPAKPRQPRPGGAAEGRAVEKAARPGRLRQWAARQLDRLDKRLEALRHRAVLRLLHLLTSDPDKGLRYAIPFEEARHRGQAAPSADLVGHDVDFNLGHLGGGRPADYWNIAPDFQQRLRAAYLELAARETRLGRHRRAAYIYAELLGMLDQAAGALVAGRHWREAAALYRQRLKRPDRAAACLEQGGLWSEAIALYDELGEFEKAGDLCEKLEQHDEAAAFYRRAVARHIHSGDTLAAAHLLEQKLRAADEALDLLSAAWPDSANAVPCLREYFALVGRLGRHESAEEKVQSLYKKADDARQATDLAGLYAELSLSYPDQTVRGTAGDAVHRLAAARLRTASDNDRRALVAAVGRLAPGDRLLQRDCHRYLYPPVPPPKPAAKAVTKTPAALKAQVAGEPVLVREQQLSAEIQWAAGAVLGECWCFVGDMGNRLACAQVPHWAESPPFFRWWTFERLRSGPILMAPTERPGFVELSLFAPGCPPLHYDNLRTMGNNKPARIGTPGWVTEETVGLQRSDDGRIHLLRSERQALLWQIISPNGSPLRTQRVVAEGREVFASRHQPYPPFAVRDGDAYVGLGDTLLRLHADGRSEVIDLPGEIRGLVCSMPYTVPRIIASLDEGAAICWADGSGKSHYIGHDLVEPLAVFTRSGWIVLADEKQCHVFRTQVHRVQCMMTMPGKGSRPVALLPGGQPDEFALLTADGWLRVYRLPRMQ